MTYANEIQKDSVEINYLVRFGCRITLDHTWTHVSGSTYYRSWNKKWPGKIQIYSSTALLDTFSPVNSLAELTALGPGRRLFFDQNRGRLYIHGGSDPTDSAKNIYAELFYLVSTKYFGWNFDPTDEDSPVVQYQGLLLNQPDIAVAVDQSIYGFLPAQSGSIDIINLSSYFDTDFVFGSISSCVFEIYRCVGELKTENIILACRGFTRNANFNANQLTVDYVDASSLLDNQISNNKYGALAEPELVGATQRVFFSGNSRRVLGVNSVDYNPANTTSDNRIWSFGSFAKAGLKHYPVNNSLVGSNTGNRTYLQSVVGLAVDDYMTTSEASAFVGSLQITAVGANYIDHTTIAARSTDQILYRAATQNIQILNRTTLDLYLVDLSSITFLGGTAATIQFNTSLESNLSLPSNLNTQEYAVFCDVCVQQFETNGAAGTDNYSRNAVDSVYNILRMAGFSDSSYFNLASFVAAAADSIIDVDFASPRNYNEFSSETYREVMSKVCETALLKVYMKNGQWNVNTIAPLGSTTLTVTQENIKEGFSYEFLTEDIISSAVIKYDYGEVSLINTISQDSWRSVNANNITSLGVNFNQKQKTIEIYSGNQTIAEKVRDRYLYLFSQPLCYLTLELDLSSLGTSLNDIIAVNPEGLDSFYFTDTQRFSVLGITEKESTIEVLLFDQRGIEENSGSW